MAVSTCEIENVAVPPIAYWRTNPAAAQGTEINPARKAAIDIDDLFLGRNFFTKMKIK
jgi:hypothetical protein